MPSLLFHAQFYADDSGWYQGAYSLGPLFSLAHPAAGYFVMFQRLVASASLALPIIAVPTFFNIVALAVDAGGICYLLSSRMASAIPSLPVRVAIALLVIGVPNAYDTGGNLTNAQWFLGLGAFLVIFARPARSKAGGLLDGLIVIIGGLTGPYCFLLEPVIGWRWLHDRDNRRLRYLVAANTACVAAQVFALLIRAGSERASGALGAGLLPLVQMIARQVTLGLVIGTHGLTSVVSSPAAGSTAALAALAVIPLVVCALAVWRGPAMLRAFCVVAGLELGLALVAPKVAAPRWPSLGEPADIVNFHPGGIRYFLYPLLAFAISLGWLAVRGRWWQRDWLRRFRAGAFREAALHVAGFAAIALLLLTALIGVPGDWAHPPYIEEHWGAEVQRLQTAPHDTVVVIPLNPAGWSVSLVAR